MAKILVVEDNELNLRLFYDLLLSKGHHVLTCGESLSVIPLLLKERPDLVLMDIQMPEVSGLDLTKRIRKNRFLRETKIIAVSAFAMPDDKKLILQAGCNDYLSKPIDLKLFFETIDKWLNA